MDQTKSKIHSLEMLLHKYAQKSGAAWHIQLDVMSQCGWQIEVRITPEPDANGPDVSTVFVLGGYDGPEECAQKILPSIKKYLGSLQKKAL